MSEVSNLGTGGRLLQLMAENADLRTMLLNERNEWDAQHKRQADTNAALAARLAEAEAKIDALMLEFCPDEMTAEQKARWASHQRVAAAYNTNPQENDIHE